MGCRSLEAMGMLAVFCLVAFGCGRSDENLVRVRGSVTDAGRPLEVAGRDVGLGSVRIEFHRLDEAGSPVGAPEGTEVGPDGRFDVPGPDGRGIAPGMYRVSIRQWDPYPLVDRLDGRFDEHNSPIVREVGRGREIAIDLARPEP